jgi:2'-5' RNA ligase
MRLFVAIEIPEYLRDELDRRARALRGKLPKARWVRPQGMHLTLSFLGETAPERLDELHRELAASCAESEAIGLRLNETGAFPPRGKARVLWAGLAGADGRPSAALARLHTAVAAAVERAAGVVPDSRPFHPHLTLARCSPPWPREALERFLGDFGPLPADAFTVAEGVLFESELRPDGARYRVVGSYPLGGGE